MLNAKRFGAVLAVLAIWVYVILPVVEFLARV